MSFCQSWTKVWKLDDSDTKKISFGLFYFVNGIIPLVTAFCNELTSDELDGEQQNTLKQFGDAILVSNCVITCYIRVI